MNYNVLKDFAKHAQLMIDSGVVEDRLRHFLSSKLIDIFPDCPWWIQAHIEGTEFRANFSEGDRNRIGFIDAVVGKTAIEYEKNLNQKTIFEHGYYQVKEYCAALCNIGILEEEIFGVLSDTVRWYGYSISLKKYKDDGLYGPDDIELIQISFIDLSKETEEEFLRFESFINKFLNRVQSRILNANTLVLDFGMDSAFYHKCIPVLRKTINNAFKEKSDYAALIRNVWQNFIAYLGVSDYGTFSIDTYINEFYLVTVAKTLCANIMANEPIISDNDEIKMILNGEYFTKQNIFNLVDYDYFGWLNNSPYVDCFIDIVGELQHRLIAYDFSRIIETDIFGKLLAQLADKEHRLMLGQEFTPHWIAHDIVAYNLTSLDEKIPRILDMCCGSGVFLIETIKEVRKKYDIVQERYNSQKDNIVFSCVVGFDIDPLAVMLAKVNWIMSMRDLFSVHNGDITVPIYHADSLFVATPITHQMPDANTNAYILNFDGHKVFLPTFLLSPEYRKFFDISMSKVYRLAMIRASEKPISIEHSIINDLIEKSEEESSVMIPNEKRQVISSFIIELVKALERLQREGRNGIWYFILCNSYRPGLTSHQFNCIVSNPPWMAMSKLSDNPYKKIVQSIALKYDIKPVDASFLHMELATIFLLSAIDRYLEAEAQWSCIMPGSLLSGLNHEPLRREKYRSINTPLPVQFESIWELPINTFKNKAIVLSGKKSNKSTPEALKGRMYTDIGVYSESYFTLNFQGNRSAWTNKGQEVEVIDILSENSLQFSQGCDLFPRTALFHEFKKRVNGNWDIAPINHTSDLWYLVSDQKKESCKGLRAEDIDKEYIFDAFISKHLSPFIMSSPAKVLIPGKKENGIWKQITSVDKALMNISTSYVFNQIVNDENTPDNLEAYYGTINIYGKLEKQDFSLKNWLVLSNAGGANPCAAYISLNEFNRSRIIIDQTLYWYLADSEDEAVFIVGLLNSNALSKAIKDFQPEGGFGKRHIHTLPYKIIPSFNCHDSSHIDVITQTRILMNEWKELCKEKEFSDLIQPNSSSLNSRRRRQQAAIRNLASYNEYEDVCNSVLG